MIERVLLVDISGGSLGSLAQGLEDLGLEVIRCTSEPPPIPPSRVIGIVVHYKRAREIKKLKSAPGLTGKPLVIWYPSKAPDKAVKTWPQTGAHDFFVGSSHPARLRIRLRGLANLMRSKLPWLQESVEGLMRIHKAAISREDDFTVLKTIARELENAFPHTFCAIMMISIRERAGMVITQGDSKSPLNILLDINRYPEIQKMLVTRKPVAIRNAQKHPLMKEVHELLLAKDLKSILAVPIFYRDEVIGLIMIRSLGRTRSFGRVEINFCEMVAQSTAVSLRNIRLGREVAEEVKKTREARRLAKKKTDDLARMEAIFDHASDGVVVSSDQGKIHGINVNFMRLSGYEKEDVDNENLDDIFFPAPGEPVSLTKTLKSRKGRTLRSSQILHCKDGSRKYVAIRAETLPKRKEWLISLHDITEERELEDALRRTNEFLENLIQSSMDAIIAADMNGLIILFNSAAEKISGYKSRQVIGKMNIVDFYAPGVARDIMRKLRSDDYGGRGKLEASFNTIIDKNGEEIPINMSAAIIYEENREAATVGIFQDLRERIRIEKELKQAQEKLMESQRKEALTALSGAAAHELNQPLTSILGYSELLRRVEKNLANEIPDHPAISSLKNAAEIIGQEAERMADVVRKIGDVSEFETREYVGGAVIMDLDRARGGVEDQNLPIWRAMFRNMKEAMIVIDDSTVVRLANPAAIAIAGENPVGKTFTRYLKGIEHTRAMESLEKLKKGNNVELELELSLPNGSSPLIQGYAIPIPDRNEYMITYSDVTEFKKAEQNLRDLTAFHGQLMRNTTLPLMATDVDGKVTFWNYAAEKLFGYSLEKMKGSLPNTLYEDSSLEKYYEYNRRLRREGDLAQETRMKKRSGEVIRVYRVDAAMRDDRGKAQGFLSMMFDLSERQAFEAELKEKTEQITLINEIVEAIRTQLGLEEGIGGVLKKLAEVFPLDLCAVTIADEAARDLLIISYDSEKQKTYKNTLRLYADSDAVRKVLFAEQPAVFDDVGQLLPQSFPGDVGREMQALDKKGFHSVITYPLNFRGEVLGTLHTLSRETGLYTNEHMDRLSQVAGPIVMALANARLFNQIERQNLELSRRTAWMEGLIRAGQSVRMEMRPEQVLEKLLMPYLDAHPYQHLTAWLEDHESGALRLIKANYYENIEKQKTLELDPEILGLLRSRNKTLDLNLEDPSVKYKPILEDSKTAVIVPIAALDQWLGAIILESHHSRAFNEEEKLEVQILAANIANALRNLKFYRELDLALRFQQGMIRDANALILLLNQDGRVVLVNRAFQELLGVDVEGIVGRGYRRFFEKYLQFETEDGVLIRPNDKKFKSLLKKVMKGESLVNLRVTIFAEDGRESKAVFNTSSVLDREGNFQGFIAIGQNITRFRELEEQMLQAEKMATMGQMAAGIAHELNNPLTGIINVATMLYNRETLEDKERALVEQLNHEARRIENLVQNLMSYSRPSREEIFPLNLRQIVLDSLSFSQYELSRGQVTVETRIPEGLDPVRGIKDQLQQLFINLLTNASHACAEKGGGKVTIDAAPKSKSRIEIRVSDDGVGIPEQNLKKLFDPFFTTKPEGKGTGLGLTIVNDIVNRHEGEIRVESEPGKGTTFIVTLPVFEVKD